MPDLIQSPRFEIDRERVTLFRTPFPRRTDASITQLAGRLGVKGKVEDMGSHMLVRDRRSALEVFLASDSIRWSTLQNGKSEAPPTAEIALPEEASARKEAGAFLRKHKISTQAASVESVTQSVLSRVERRRKTVETTPVALHVNYRFALEGLPVFGPGAKIQVTFGNQKRVVEFYRFWRATKADQDLELLRPQAALELLREDSSLADLRAGDAKVVLHRARLGYYALPPRESQGALIPVYAFDGTVSTPELERYDFVRYVVGVRFTPEDAKQVGAAFRSSGPVFS